MSNILENKINIFNKTKIIHLVLYSDDKYYNQMYNITSKYYKKFTNVKTIYYKFSDKTELIDDILTIEGYEFKIKYFIK